jgi:hypothetical protein
MSRACALTRIRYWPPCLRARKDPVLAPKEIHQLVHDALAELDRVELFANSFMQGSRAAGKEADLNLLLAPLARAQAALCPRHPPAQRATAGPAGTAASVGHPPHGGCRSA